MSMIKKIKVKGRINWEYLSHKNGYGSRHDLLKCLYEKLGGVVAIAEKLSISKYSVAKAMKQDGVEMTRAKIKCNIDRKFEVNRVKEGGRKPDCKFYGKCLHDIAKKPTENSNENFCLYCNRYWPVALEDPVDMRCGNDQFLNNNTMYNSLRKK